MLATLLLAAALTGHSAPPRQTPHLVVLVVVDQLRPDYLTRYAAQLDGGLGRFLREGTLFLHAVQDHAITETAPGHAVLLSGRYPSHTGIISNTLGVGDADAPLVGASEIGASPRRFRGTTLLDWLIAKDSTTRWLSVSRKDRGAILPVGLARGPVFWWANGGFVTSRYYGAELPDWVRAFNARNPAATLAGTTWDLLRPAAEYLEPDTVGFENAGSDLVFPHRLPAQPDTAAQRLPSYPVMDSLTLAFALEGTRTLGLGTAERTDLLVIALSTTDAVGHAFGPESREIHDQVLRVDRWLGQFLDSLSTLVPADRLLVVLTADHGVQSFPEYTLAVRHQRAGRLWFGGLAEQVNGATRSRYQVNPGLTFESGLIYGDTTVLHDRGVNVDSLSRALAADIQALPGVRRTYTPRELTHARPTDPDATAWRHQLPADFAWLVCATLEPGYVWSPGRLIAEHGSATPLDQEVPIGFLGAGIPRNRIMWSVPTVDIAPTLALLLGLRPSQPLDGEVLEELRPVRRP